MTCFAKVIERLQLSDQWTSDTEMCWLHSILHYADQHNAGGGDPSPNPFTATALRLQTAGINANTLTRIQQLLAQSEVKFAAGGRP